LSRRVKIDIMGENERRCSAQPSVDSAKLALPKLATTATARTSVANLPDDVTT
jgi:hypothetical protein